MSLKLKALGLGLIAALAMSAVTVMNATAGTGGHFYASSGGVQFNHPIIKTTEEGAHKLHLISHGLGGEIGCTESNYETTLTTGKTGTVEVFPSFAGCTTTGSSAVTVTMNGCSYVFKVAAGTTNETEQTADLKCPGTNKVEVHHPNCTIKIAPQTNVGNLTFTTDVTEGRHILTFHVNAQFATQFEGGICIFTGTNHTGTLEGSATVEAFNTAGEKIDLTAT